jgi:filamentous hemagglutinin
LFNTLAAASFNLVGDYMKNVLADGSLPKVAIHAIREGDRFIWCLPSSAKPK